MKLTSRVAAAAAILINPRTLMPLGAIVAASLLATFTQVVESAGTGLLAAPAAAASAPAVQASAPARAASAPASAASASIQAARAPQPQASSPTAAVTPAPAASAAERPRVYTVMPGDGLIKVFGAKAAKVCKDNFLRRCDDITVGQELKLFDGVEPREVKAKAKRATPQVTTPKAMPVVREQSCIKLGAQPFNPDHNLERALQGIDAMKTLSAEKKEIAKAKVRAGDKATSNELVGRQVFKEMLYQDKKGQLIHVFEKPICDPDNQGGQPEVMDTYDLGDGIQLSIPRRCGNPSWFIRRKPDVPPPVDTSRDDTPPQQPPQENPPRDGPLSETPPARTPPTEVEETVVQTDDWDLGFYTGGDRDVRYAGGEGAYYPWLSHQAWGRYAAGIGGFVNTWNGETPSGYGFHGHYGGLGLAQKWSTYERRDLGVKFPMIGFLHEQGGQGAYHEERRAKLLCASLSFNDASREKAGEKTLPEWQIWASLCDPLSQSKSATVFNQPASTAKMQQDIQHIVSVGGRVYLTKDLTGLMGEGGIAAKLQPFVEVGANQTAPFPHSAHAYLGLRTVNKVWGCGVGPHWSQAGTVIGATCTYDAGRHYKLTVQEERWSAMVKSLEALGVAVD